MSTKKTSFSMVLTVARLKEVLLNFSDEDIATVNITRKVKPIIKPLIVQFPIPSFKPPLYPNPKSPTCHIRPNNYKFLRSPRNVQSIRFIINKAREQRKNRVD